MDIPKKLPQFNQERAFMCVVGSKYGIIYFLSKGVLMPLTEMEEELPPVDVNDGFFLRSGFGEQLGTWEQNQEVQTEIEKRFFKKIREDLVTYIKALAPQTVYLFCPSHIHARLQGELSSITNVEIVLVKKGNFTKEEPLSLLEMIDHAHASKDDPRDPSSVQENDTGAKEKQKILLKAQQANGKLA